MATWKAKSFECLCLTEVLLSLQKRASGHLTIFYHVFMLVKYKKAEK